eukprot:GEMP01018384.1.p1 GENE.GEMP01018384.1~~GEMP01018384.1.p1  ORF type:complete len:581 (+),score=164.01 GEMP01018384.1:134-1876(+)
MNIRLLLSSAYFFNGVLADLSCVGQQAPLKITPPFTSVQNSLRIEYSGPRPFVVHNAENRLSLAAHDMGFLELDGKRHVAQYLEFHSPAEHTIGNAGSLPLELQVFHRAPSGHTVALSILFQKGKGSRAVQEILNALAKNWDQVPSLDLSKYVGPSSEYFSYSTAQCAEWDHFPVDRWIVLTKMKKVNARQLALLRRLVPRLAQTTRREKTRLTATLIQRSTRMSMVQTYASGIGEQQVQQPRQLQLQQQLEQQLQRQPQQQQQYTPVNFAFQQQEEQQEYNTWLEKFQAYQNQLRAYSGPPAITVPNTGFLAPAPMEYAPQAAYAVPNAGATSVGASFSPAYTPMGVRFLQVDPLRQREEADRQWEARLKEQEAGLQEKLSATVETLPNYPTPDKFRVQLNAQVHKVHAKKTKPRVKSVPLIASATSDAVHKIDTIVAHPTQAHVHEVPKPPFARAKSAHLALTSVKPVSPAGQKAIRKTVPRSTSASTALLQRALSGASDLRIIQAAAIPAASVDNEDASNVEPVPVLEKKEGASPGIMEEDSAATIKADRLGQFADNDDLEAILLQKSMKRLRSKHA